MTFSAIDLNLVESLKDPEVKKGFDDEMSRQEEAARMVASGVKTADELDAQAAIRAAQSQPGTPELAELTQISKEFFERQHAESQARDRIVKAAREWSTWMGNALLGPNMLERPDVVLAKAIDAYNRDFGEETP